MKFSLNVFVGGRPHSPLDLPEQGSGDLTGSLALSAKESMRHLHPQLSMRFRTAAQKLCVQFFPSSTTPGEFTPEHEAFQSYVSAKRTLELFLCAFCWFRDLARSILQIHNSSHVFAETAAEERTTRSFLHQNQLIYIHPIDPEPDTGGGTDAAPNLIRKNLTPHPFRREPKFFLDSDLPIFF